MQIVKNCSIAELLSIITDKASNESIIFTDVFKSYDGLIDYGYKHHFRIIHSKNEFAVGNNHINGIENFLGLCKVRLTKFRGIKKSNFYLHIKECEFDSTIEKNLKCKLS